MIYDDDEREEELDGAAKKIFDSFNRLKAKSATASTVDSFDDSRYWHACAQDHVADFLKQHCNVRRRASLLEGPTRCNRMRATGGKSFPTSLDDGPSQGGGHGR